MREIRGNDISMIFQEPMTALNPVFTVGNQIMETVQLHQGLDKDAARAHAIRMLEKVGIPSPEQRVDEYPHQLSGGMRQRVMIAMAMACSPALLIADEPTTALDVTIQAQVLDLIKDLQAREGMSVLLITHDLGLVAGAADRIQVMYAGRVFERGTTDQIFYGSQNPYTRGLMNSIPRVDTAGERLTPIPGAPPSLLALPAGCAFRPRCAFADDQCRAAAAELHVVEDGHESRCHHVDALPALEVTSS